MANVLAQQSKGVHPCSKVIAFLQCQNMVIKCNISIFIESCYEVFWSEQVKLLNVSFARLESEVVSKVRKMLFQNDEYWDKKLMIWTNSRNAISENLPHGPILKYQGNSYACITSPYSDSGAGTRHLNSVLDQKTIHDWRV